MNSSLDSWLQEGITAARAGDAAQARPLLFRVVQHDEDNLAAWYWLSRVVERPLERQICLENVLALDPGHTAVRDELAALRREMAEAQAALLSKEAIAAAVPQTAEEALIADAAVEPLACPFCGQVGPVAARACPHCGGALYARRPKSKDHSLYSLGLVVLWVALANYVWLGVAAYYFLSGLSSVARFLGITLPGSEAGLLPVLLAGCLVFGFSLVVAWGLYRRLRFFYWLTVALLLAGLLYRVYAAAAADTVSLLRLGALGAIFFLALGFAFLAYDEFAWVEDRLSADLDRDVDSPSSLYARGREYADKGMWAKAATHYAKAVALSPGHPEYRVALAAACLNLGQPERAREHLAEAQRIEPSHPQLAELLAALEDRV